MAGTKAVLKKSTPVDETTKKDCKAALDKVEVEMVKIVEHYDNLMHIYNEQNPPMDIFTSKKKPIDVTDKDAFSYNNISDNCSKYWKGKDGDKIREYFTPGNTGGFSWFRTFPFKEGEYGECVAACKHSAEELAKDNWEVEIPP